MIENIQLSLYNAMVRNIAQEKGSGPGQARLFTVDDMAVTNALGGNRKVLNSIMIAEAVRAGCLPFTEEELCAAATVCVKSQFAEMNTQAIRMALGS